MKETLKKYISKLDIFNEDEINAIVENTRLEFFKKGTVLLQEGEVCTTCYFVLNGCVRQYQVVEGTEKTTAFFTEEQAAISYASYMERKASNHNLSCLEDCILITGTRADEQKLHERYPKLEYLVRTIMPHDFAKMQEHLASLINHSPEERYEILIKNQPQMVNRVPLHHLASYIGVTPESFSRIRKRILLKQKSKSSSE